MIITDRAIYLREIVGGPSRVEIYTHEGKRLGTLPLPEVAAVDEVESLDDGSLLYDVETYLRPPYFSRYREATGKAEDTALAQTSPVQFDDTEVLREFATSKDGTRVPVNIVRRKGTVLNGTNPVLVYAATAATTTTKFPTSWDRPRACGSTLVASTCSPICAAAASSVKTGTARAP